MNTFRIQWAFGASTIVQADWFQEEGMWYRFFRGKKQVAQCARILVLGIHQLRGLPERERTAGDACNAEMALAAA